MNNALQIFEEEGFTARTIEDNGEIWIVAKDVAQSLGYSEASNPSRLFSIVPDIWAGVKRIHTRSENGVEQEREILCLTEQGLYFFLGRSDKKAALLYQMWIAGKVVPSIRKHGFYGTPATVEDILANPDNFIQVLLAFKAEQEKVKALETKLETDKPKVVFADAVDASKDSILIGNFAKLLCQNGINVGQNRLFAWLREHGYLITKGERRNFPQQQYVDCGYFTVKKSVVHNPDGSIRETHTTKITGKGQIYFLNRFLDGTFKI